MSGPGVFGGWPGSAHCEVRRTARSGAMPVRRNASPAHCHVRRTAMFGRVRPRRLEWFLMTARPLHEMMEHGWATALEPVAGRIRSMGDFLRAEVAAGRSYLPAGDLVLRAFQQPFADVRVLIVGQDPYPTPGNPVGLSFSVAPETRRLPASLVNIFREYGEDLGYPRPATGDLSVWTERGVMLLNRVLTVQPGKPGAHRGQGWEEVTEQAIRALADRDSPLVAILWGRDARSLAPLLGARSEEHTSELQSRPHLVCRLLLEKKKPIHMDLSFVEKKKKKIK